MSVRPRRTTSRPGRHRALPTFESFEPRLLLTVYTVTNALDSGPGSLRDAINNINNDFLPDTIDFSIGRGQQRILLQSALPAITTQVTIDGTTQPGYSPTKKVPQIVIDGSQTGDPGQEGLQIQADNSIVEGLSIINSGDSGLVITPITCRSIRIILESTRSKVWPPPTPTPEFSSNSAPTPLSGHLARGI